MAFARIQLITHPKDKPTMKTTNGTSQPFLVELLDEDGAPIDLSRYSSANKTAVTGTRPLPLTTGCLFLVSSYFGQGEPDVSRVVSIYGEDPTLGIVSVIVQPDDLEFPGLYLAEIALAYNGQMEQSFPFYLESAPSMQWSESAPITVAEIRLWSRDHSPEVNDLLDEVEFKDAEIVAAIRRVVDIWNSTPPMMVRHTYNPKTFPQAFRSQWINATIGLLKNMAADWYDRNNLTYNAGGISIDDRNKSRVYREDSVRRMNEFYRWMDGAKRQLNATGAWGRTGYFELP